MFRELERPREGPETFKEAQGGEESPGEAQRGSERPRKAHT